MLLALSLSLSWPAVPASAGEIILETDNDYLTANNPEDDDLYTFALTLGWDAGEREVRFRENSFTDKRAGTRFDETYLTVARELELGRSWTGRGELGMVYVGHGLLGEGSQNAIHRLIGNVELELDYVEGGGLYPTGYLELERVRVRGPSVVHGPVLRFQGAPGFKGSAVAAWAVEWDVPGPLAVETVAGARFAGSAFDPLSGRLKAFGAYGELGIAYRGFVASWSYNEYGTGREHVSFGYRFRATDARSTGG